MTRRSTDRPRRRGLPAAGAAALLAAANAGVLAVSADVAEAHQSGSASCASGGNSAAVACNFGYLVPQTAISTGFNNVPMAMSPADLSFGLHIYQGIWAFGNGCGGAGSAWVETGVTRGFHGNPDYGRVMARNSPALAVPYQDWWLGSAPEDNSAHSYEIDASPQTWKIYRDNALQFEGNGLSYGNFICQGAAGLEVSNGGLVPTTTSGAFQSKPLKWRDANNTWQPNWMSTSNWSVDNSCDHHAMGSCLQGLYWSSSNWGSAKP